jgi:hypothetical protein
MATSLAKTYGDQLRDIIKEYRHAGESWPATAREIAVWAYNNGEIVPQPGSVIKQIARDIADAMREDYYTDPQGRTVRVKHAARKTVNGKQKMLWDDIRTADPEHMEKSLKLRRTQIVGDCCQLKRDQDSYNDNNSHGANIQLKFNFEKDIAEAEAVAPHSKNVRTKNPR